MVHILSLDCTEQPRHSCNAKVSHSIRFKIIVSTKPPNTGDKAVLMFRRKEVEEN